ncbi:MAG: ATP-binding protein [Gemmatimonadaceae bacterium]
MGGSSEIFAGDQILTTAIPDRLLHHVQAVHIDGRSHRLREPGARLEPRPEPVMHNRSEQGAEATN